MSIVNSFLGFFLNLDTNLTAIIQIYGAWIYPLLFLIIFFETGVVIAPFLPGDSLIFAAGTLSALGLLNIFLLFIILCLAAISGDTINYFIGSFIGEKIIKKGYANEKYIARTHEFFSKYGGKAVVIARFVPIIRTFVPFIAGLGNMKYTRFLTYNVIGGILWVSLFLFAGFYFGNIPFIKNNFSLAIITIIIISLIPAIIQYFKIRKS